MGMWELKKANNGQIFGPVDMEALKRWSANGQISPMDTIIDLETRKQYAPYEVDELEMIWEVTLEDGAVYGPTHANAVRVFVREGQILPKDTVRDILRGEKFLAGEFELYLEKQYPLQKAEPPPESQAIAAQDDRKGETRLRPVDGGHKKDSSKTRLKPLDEEELAELDVENLRRKAEQLMEALRGEQANYEKLKQHYQDLNQRFVELKDRVKAMGGAVGE